MKCTICKCDFSNPNIFIAHLNYTHNISNNYTCFEDSCNRIFNRRDAFKKHITLHDLSNTHSPNDTYMETEVEKQSLNDLNNSSASTVSPAVVDINNSDNSEPKRTDDFTLDTFCKILQSNIDKLISNLYTVLALNRSIIQEIILQFSNFFSSGLISIIKEALTLNGKECQDMLTLLENPFKSFDTEFKRLKYFERSNCFIRPMPFSIGTSTAPSRIKGETSLVLKQRYGYFIPMRILIKSFLEIPGVYDTMCQYRRNVLSEDIRSSHVISNIMQADLWQEYLKKCTHDNVFPIVLYFDDFEINNPLGSHAGIYKQGAVYFSIPSFPPEFSTRLDNIFLAMLFHSRDRVMNGNKATFSVLINELLFLENNGITVNKNKEKVYFSLVLLIGDNLGLHSLFGLSESFSANYYCRFCKSHKEDMQRSFKEDENLLRTADEYKNCVENKLFGVKEDCIFHELPNFHISNNLTCDIMHDLTEGVHRYSMAKIISYFIEQKVFNLKSLNDRIKYYSYSCMERNIPPSIKEDHLKNGCIILSSAEMLCLVLNFRLIIGDLIPEDDKVWNYYLILLEITESLVATSITPPGIELLNTLIEEHNYLYVTLFEDYLKPKFHFLLHYHRVIKKVGPLCHIQSIRFEAKHKEFKTNSHVVPTRRNISLTLSTRMQLKLCHRFLSQQGMEDISLMGPVYKLPSDETIFKDFIDTNNTFCIEWYEFNGIRYNSQSVLIYDNITDVPQFCQVNYIIVSDNIVYFICKIFQTEHYSIHLRSFKIEFSTGCKNFEFSFFKNNAPVNIHYLPNGGKYVFVSK